MRHFKHILFVTFIVLISTNLNAQTRIQTATGNSGPAAATTYNVVLSATPQNGNTLIAVISSRATTTNNVTSITQTGVTWTRAISSTGNTTNGTVTEIWYSTAVTSAATTATITLPSAARSAAVIIEYSGLAYGSPLDVVKSNFNTSTNGNPSTGTTLTATSENDELWIGAIGLRSSGYTLTSITNSFTSVANSSSTSSTSTYNAKIYALERVVSTTGTASTGGATTKSYWSGAVATFKLNSLNSFSPLGACKGDGTTVTLNGFGFTESTVAAFNGIDATTTFVNSTQVTATLPATATSGFITTTTGTTVLTSKKPFLVKAPQVPTANITNTTCPSSNDGAVSPNNIPIAINFNYAANQYVNLGSSMLNNLTAFTLEGWIKTTTYNRNSFFGQNNAVEIGFASNGTIELWTEGLTTNVYTPTVFPTDGAWHHVAGTGDGTNLKIYIDGELFVTKAHAALPTIKYGSSPDSTMIGGFVWDAVSPNYFNGQMLKVGFWNRALTNTEIADLASSPHEYYDAEPNLIAGYNFFEGAGTTLAKTPAGATNGTLTGTAVPTWTDLFTYNWTKSTGDFSASTKNISSIPTGTYNLAATFNGCTANSQDFVVASNGTISTAADSISGTSPVCANTEVTLTLNGGALGTGASWKWYADACGTNEITTGLNAGKDILTITPTSTTTYYVRAEGDCNTTACVSKTIVVNATGTWLGITNDWNDAQNWCGSIPTSTSNVMIPQTPVGGYQPVIGVNDADAICNSLTIDTGATVTFSGTANTLTMYRNLINNGSLAANTSTVIFDGTSAISGASITTFNKLTINSTKTLTAPADTLKLMGNFTNNGTFTHNSGTLMFNGSSAQTIIGESTFNNLTINNTAGVIAGSNFTVNGVLNLASANPSATKGALEMVSDYTGYPATDLNYKSELLLTNPITSYVLTMGANATTVGQGDVTGKIYRSSILANTPYSFGNEFTNYAYTVAPTNVTLTVTIGTAYGKATVWGDVNSVQRSYEMAPTGGDGGRVAMNLHYLQTELNGNTEQLLVTGDYDIGPDGAPLGDEHGRSSYDFTNNYIGLSGVPIAYFKTNDTDHRWRTVFILHNYYTGHTTWDGSTSTSWNDDTNWSNGRPGEAMTAIIPDSASTPHDPVLPSANAVIGGMQLLPGGFLNLNSDTITLAGYNFNGWEDQSGLSNYAGSTVIFKNNEIIDALKTTMPISGVPHFDNVIINADAVVTANLNSHIYISSTFTNNGTFNASGFDNTIEYNGSAAQTIVNPYNSSYYGLALTGSGTKTLPEAPMSILQNLDLSATFTATSNTLVFNGTTPQTLSGNSISALNNVTLNNANGLTLSKNQTIDGVFTLTNGLITTGNSVLTLGCLASTLGEKTTSYVNGKLSREYCAAGSKLYPMGKGGAYRPLTLEYTTLLGGNSTIQAEQFESVIPGSIFPDYSTYPSYRYWNLTETAGTGNGNYLITLNGNPFTPAATAKILRGDATTNSALSATYSDPNFASASVTDDVFGNFTVASECLPPTISSHPRDTTGCELNSTPTFTVTPAAGTYLYSWEVYNGSVWSTVSNDAIYSGATTATLTLTNPAFVLNNYQFRSIVTRVDCGGSSTSNVATLTVNPQPQGVLSGTTNICKGEIGYLTWTATAGTGPFTVIYDAGDGAGNQTVNGVSSTVPFSVGAHTANKTYTLVSVTDANCIRTSGFTQGSADITVNPYITWTGVTSTDWQTATNWCGGVPTTNEDVLIPSLPANQPVISDTGTGYVHSIIVENGASVTVNGAYEFNVSGDITNAGTISMTTGTLAIAASTVVENIGIIETQNTSAQPLPVSPHYGNSGTIRFNSTAAPQVLFAGTYNDVIVDNPLGVTMGTNASVVANGTLEIKSGSKLEIGTGRVVQVRNVINAAGDAGIRIKSDANQPSGTLIFSNAESSAVNATVEMYSKAKWDKTQAVNAKYKWQFMGIPVQSLDALPTFYGGFVRRYNEAGIGYGYLETNRWIQLQNGDMLEALAGYEIVQQYETKFEFPGILYNQSIQKTLSYTAGADYPGQHLIGNPYTAAIDIKQITFDANTDSTVYLYNTGTFNSWSSYSSSTSADSVAFTAGQYTAIPQLLAGSSSLPSQIPSMQAFMVRTKGTAAGSITVNYDAVKQKNFSVQRAKQEQLSSLRMNLIGEKMDNDVMWLFSEDGTTRNFDNGWDALKMGGDAGTARIQTVENDNWFQINTVPDVNQMEIWARRGANDSNYKLKITNEKMMDKYNQLYLLDLATNNLIDISQDVTEYNFSMTNTSSEPRFKVLTSAGMTTELQNPMVQFSNGKLICTDWTKVIDIQIFNTQGVEISNIDVSAIASKTASKAVDLHLKPGVYIINLTSTDHTQQSTKIIVK